MSNAMKELYSKHKDRDPQGTVDGIVEMLEQAGLDTEVRWTSHPFEGLCSNRVTIAGTNIGTNGKGTSEQYCLASGYAEFMERLQNIILGSTALSGAGDATTSLSVACARLLAFGLPATVQLDVHEDGSLVSTFGLTLFFTGTHNARLSLISPGGAADEALRHLEALGLADGRWQHAVRGSFALPVPLAPKSGAPRVAGAICRPDCVKLKWTHGRLAPARFYQVLRVAPLEMAASTS